MSNDIRKGNLRHSQADPSQAGSLEPDSLLERHTADSMDLLERMLRIPALSRQENARADFLEAELAARGLAPERIGQNLILRSEANPAWPWVWLVSHIDTVPPAAGWSVDPHAGSFQDGKLTALGANDAGGPLMAMLAAYRALTANPPVTGASPPAPPLRANLLWIAAAEEEVTGQGGVRSLISHLPPANLALVGEPTSLHAAVAEKGLLVIDGLVRGKAGHAARSEGQNAIYNALPDIQWFREYRFPDVSPHLGPMHMNLTVLHAGDKHNAVPDECRYTVDIRLTDTYTHEQVLQTVRAHVRADITPRSTHLRPSATPAGHPVRRTLRELSIPEYGSPTLSDMSQIPYPAVKLGPGDSARSHTADEYILAAELAAAARLYADLLTRTYPPAP